MSNWRIEVTSRPYGASERIPDSAWRVYGRATTVRGALLVYRRAYLSVHPELNCRTGQVRALRDGLQVDALAMQYSPGYQTLTEAVRALEWYLHRGAELPNAEELLGIDPEYTGDLSSAEYLESVRGG